MIARRALLVVAGVLLLVALGELAARGFLARLASDAQIQKYGSLEQLRARWRQRITPHRYLGYVNTPGFRLGADEHDSRGFRGAELADPKPQGEFRIACLGGSTTYSTTVADWRASYPAQLEAQLVAEGYREVRVINAGVQGWSSFESLLNLPLRLLETAPDLLIVYHGVNEAPTRLVWPPEAYRGDNSGFRKHPASFHARGGLASWSALARVVGVRAGRLPPSSALFELDPPTETWIGDELDRQMWAGQYPSGRFTELSAERIVAGNPPIHFRRNVESLIAIAEAQGITVVLATYAHLPPSSEERDSSYNSRVFTQSIAETNAVLRSIARERGVLFDYAAALPLERRHYHTWTRAGRELVDIHHPNAEGYRLQAAAFARFLIENGLLARRLIERR